MRCALPNFVTKFASHHANFCALYRKAGGPQTTKGHQMGTRFGKILAVAQFVVVLKYLSLFEEVKL